MILPLVSVEENIAVQRETKARTILLQSLPEDHMADFHHLDDARDNCMAAKQVGGNDDPKNARNSMLSRIFQFRVSESEGLHKGYDRFQKILSQLNQMQAKPDNEDCNMNYSEHFHLLSQNWGEDDVTGRNVQGSIRNIKQVLLHSKLKELDKSEEPKALLSVDSMLNWSDHEGEDEEKGVAQVYGMIAGDDDDTAGAACDDVSDAAAEFALMGLSSQVQAYKNTLQTLEQQKAWYQSNQLALEERIRILTADLENTTNMLKYTEKLNDQVKLEKLNDQVKLEESKARFVKAVGMHVVPSPITGTFMPPSNKPDLDDTQVTYGSKSNNYVETNSVSNDFVSCDNSDKSSDSETTGFASCVSSVKSSSPKTNEHLASASSSVDFKTVSKTADQKPSSTIDDPSFSFKENVKTPRNICNKSGINNRSHCKNNSFGSKTCFVCGSKFHLIKDCDFYEQQLKLYNKPKWHNVANIPSFVPRAAYVPAGSRNPPASVSAGRAFPAGSRNRPASVSAGRPFSAGWRNHAARPMTRPTSHYFQHFRRPGCYNQMYMDEGRWGTAVKTSAGCSWNKGKYQWGSKNNGDLSIYMENPHTNKDLGIENSGCSRSMTGNKEKLDNFVKIIGGTVTFGGGDGKITRKGTIRTSKLNFENVVLRVPRRHNLYSFNLTEIQPERDINYLLAKASFDESTKRHRRMAHVNFKNINKLAKHGLVNGLPSKLFTNEHNCVSYNKGKQHKASQAQTAGVKRDYSNARTPQQNRVAERKNRTLIEHAITMASDSSFLPELLRQVDMVPAGSLDPAASISAGSIDPAASSSAGSIDPAASISAEMEDIYHHPRTGIFSSSSYDADFGGTVTNLAPIVAVDPLPTRGVSPFIPSSTDSCICLIYGGFMVYTTGCEECLLYGEIDGRIYVTKPKGLKILSFPKHVYKVMKALYGLHQAPRACQDKYVQDMLRKFDMESVRPATTPYEAAKPKSKDEPDDAVNVHLYRSMIGSLMYLTASRPDIMFVVSACSRYQVTPLTSNLNAVKKIFKYLKGQPKLGLWYLRDSPFMLEAYSDSDYAGSNGDRKSTTGECQFLGRRLISWQCKIFICIL
ncbi:putative ribonuclease H-like domain-containing protein [Tanacetum coccineum]